MTLVDIAHSLDAVRDVWQPLALQSGNVFSTWEWADTWHRHMGARARLDLAVLLDDDRSVFALLPMERRRLPGVSIVRFVGHGPADELGPVTAPEHRARAMAELGGILDRGRSVLFVGDRFGGDLGPALEGARTVSRTPSPIVSFPDTDWDGYLATRSSNLRQALRRKERRLLEAGGRFRLADAESLDHDLATLFALHRERWAPRVTGFARAETFHRAFAGVALERGWLRLWIVEVGGVPAAAWMGFRFASVESYLQAGRARRFDDLSPGLLVLAHSIREAQADGMREYRFLRGDEPFKRRFADRETSIETIAATRGAVAAAMLRLGGLERVLPRRLARRLR